MQLSKTKLRKRKVSLVSTKNRTQHFAKEMKLAHDQEKEYNDNNLFFYCKYFNMKTKSIKPLPSCFTELKNKYLTSFKKS